MVELSCPKCGESDWQVSRDELIDKSAAALLMTIGEKRTDVINKVLAEAPHYEVVFVYCGECGAVVTAAIANISA